MLPNCDLPFVVLGTRPPFLRGADPNRESRSICCSSLPFLPVAVVFIEDRAPVLKAAPRPFAGCRCRRMELLEREELSASLLAFLESESSPSLLASFRRFLAAL